MKTSSMEGAIGRRRATSTPAAASAAGRRLERPGRIGHPQVEAVAESQDVLDVGVGRGDRPGGRLRVRGQLEDTPGQRGGQLARRGLDEDPSAMHEADPTAARRLVHVGRAHDDGRAILQDAADAAARSPGASPDPRRRSARPAAAPGAGGRGRRRGRASGSCRPKAARPVGPRSRPARRRRGARQRAARRLGPVSPRTSAKKCRFSTTVRSPYRLKRCAR